MDSKQPSRPASSMLFRAAMAVALMIGFYLLALVIAAALAYVPFAEMHYAHRVHIKLAFICIASACVIVWSILPRFDRFTPPGPRLTQSEHPKLFELLQRIAAATRQEMPAEVYLCPEVNAWVAQRGGLMGFGSRRVMGLGLPLMQVFTVSEFSAVLAHEFGHYHGGDTKLGPWIYKTRAMIGRTLSGLGDSIIQKPFLWYGMLYLRITHAISRRQEYLADELAAKTVSSEALISGLKKVHRAALGFNAYLNSEFAPVFSSGMRTPFLEGFTRYCSTPKISEACEKSVEEELKDAKSDPYDTHPALKDRIAALQALQGAAQPNDNTLAISLISDYKRYELEMISALTGNEKVSEMPALAWEEVGAKVYVPLWKKSAAEHNGVLSGKTIDQLYLTAQNPSEFIKQAFPDAGEASDEDKQRATVNIVGAAICATLADNGWTVIAELGEGIRMQKDSIVFEPFSLLAQAAEGKPCKQEWDRCVGNSSNLVYG